MLDFPGYNPCRHTHDLKEYENPAYHDDMIIAALALIGVND